jgi:hypothetical protein
MVRFERRSLHEAWGAVGGVQRQQFPELPREVRVRGVERGEPRLEPGRFGFEGAVEIRRHPLPQIAVGLCHAPAPTLRSAAPSRPAGRRIRIPQVVLQQNARLIPLALCRALGDAEQLGNLD